MNCRKTLIELDCGKARIFFSTFYPLVAEWKIFRTISWAEKRLRKSASYIRLNFCLVTRKSGKRETPVSFSCVSQSLKNLKMVTSIKPMIQTLNFLLYFITLYEEPNAKDGGLNNFWATNNLKEVQKSSFQSSWQAKVKVKMLIHLSEPYKKSTQDSKFQSSSLFSSIFWPTKQH